MRIKNMKYIRTKERIYDTYSKGIQLEKNKITNEIEYYYQSCAFSVPFKLEVLSQADTIEELIDEYVRIHKTINVKPMICDKELAISSSKYPKCYDVYGSIWVDGELYIVAKMSEKGKLELL